MSGRFIFRPALNVKVTTDNLGTVSEYRPLDQLIKSSQCRPFRFRSLVNVKFLCTPTGTEPNEVDGVRPEGQL